MWNDIYYDVKDKIGSGSLVELGMGIISLQLADLYANKSVFTALTNSKCCMVVFFVFFYKKVNVLLLKT